MKDKEVEELRNTKDSVSASVTQSKVELASMVISDTDPYSFISFGTASDLTGRRTVMAAVVLVTGNSTPSAVEPTTRTSTGLSKTTG